MKRLLAFLCACLLTFCAGCGAAQPQRFQYTYTDLFDTVTTFVLYASRKTDADAWAAALYERLSRFHQLYSVYDSYDGVVNLKTVNDRAGEPVTVDKDIFDMLKLGADAYAVSGGKVNIAMGSVLRLWHEAREKALENPAAAALPDSAALQAAGAHTAIDAMVLDEKASTVCLRDTAMSLDVGAIAKGYAVQKLAAYARESGITAAMLSVGGNVVTIGTKNGNPFIIGIENPADTSTYVLSLRAIDCAVVTSGNYQRYFKVNGVRYHHLIDPATGYPANYTASVSVIGADSGMADALSTALFLLPPDEGKALLKRTPGYEAVWILEDGSRLYSDGFAGLMEN